jgi:DNA-binding transcriptional regulator YiaG
MKTCSRCQKDRVVQINLDDNMDVCGHTFTAQLPAERCGACGQVVIQGEDVQKFEQRVAVEIAKAGLRSAEAFKYMRNAAKLTAEDLASLLDVSPDFIGYWESGDWPVDPRASSVLTSLIIGQFDDQHASLDCLRVLREPRQLARKVRLHITDALAQAAKALQFGSAARSSPALA